MGLITKTYTFSAGSTILAAEHNTNYDTLYNWANGNVDNANIKSGANISFSKLSLSDDFTLTGDINLTNAATTTDILTITGGSLTTGTGLLVTSNSTSTSIRNLVQIVNDNAAADAATCLQIQQDGDAAHINLTGDSSNTTPIDGDIWYDGTSFKGYNGTATTTFGGITTLQATGTSDITEATGSYVDMTDMSLTLTGAGTYIFTFEAPIYVSGSGTNGVNIALDIDGSDVVERKYLSGAISSENTKGRTHAGIHWIATITTETTAKVQWAKVGATCTQYGTESTRVFSFVKIA